MLNFYITTSPLSAPNIYPLKSILSRNQKYSSPLHTKTFHTHLIVSYISKLFTLFPMHPQSPGVMAAWSSITVPSRAPPHPAPARRINLVQHRLHAYATLVLNNNLLDLLSDFKNNQLIFLFFSSPVLSRMADCWSSS